MQSHVYRTGDKVLEKNTWKTKFNQDSYVSRYIMTEVRNNEIVLARSDNITDTYILHNTIHYK